MRTLQCSRCRHVIDLVEQPPKAFGVGSGFESRPTQFSFMSAWQKCVSIFVAVAGFTSLHAAGFDLAASATNQLAVDLHRQLATGDENLCLSPYSIQSALAMTFAGADGETLAEMARVLHFPNDGEAIHVSFASLQRSLEDMAKKTAEIAANSKK